MTGQNDTSPKRPEHAGSPPPPMVQTAPPAAPAPPSADVENQTPATTGTGFGVPGILQRWKKEDSLRRGSLALWGLSTVFSFLAFIIMVCNKQGYLEDLGYSEDFNQYEEYRYKLIHNFGLYLNFGTQLEFGIKYYLYIYIFVAMCWQ